MQTCRTLFDLRDLGYVGRLRLHGYTLFNRLSGYGSSPFTSTRNISLFLWFAAAFLGSYLLVWGHRLTCKFEKKIQKSCRKFVTYTSRNNVETDDLPNGLSSPVCSRCVGLAHISVQLLQTPMRLGSKTCQCVMWQRPTKDNALGYDWSLITTACRKPQLSKAPLDSVSNICTWPLLKFSVMMIALSLFIEAKKITTSENTQVFISGGVFLLEDTVRERNWAIPEMTWFQWTEGEELFCRDEWRFTRKFRRHLNFRKFRKLKFFRDLRAF